MRAPRARPVRFVGPSAAKPLCPEPTTALSAARRPRNSSFMSGQADDRVAHPQNVPSTCTLIRWAESFLDHPVCESSYSYCCQCSVVPVNVTMCESVPVHAYSSLPVLPIAGRLYRYLPGFHVCASARVSMIMKRCFRGFRRIDVTTKPFRALRLSRATAR